jgi:ATP/maltotriose-dependent transcriptional regulator MalT
MAIFTTIATIVGCISACLGLAMAIIKPFRKWIIESFVRQSQAKEVKTQIDEMSKMMKQSLENDASFKKRLDSVEKNVLENEADRLRSELFDCGNRCRRGIRLHPEEMEHIRVVFTKYSQKLKQNGTGEAEYNFICNYYNHQDFPEYHTHN